MCRGCLTGCHKHARVWVTPGWTPFSESMRPPRRMSGGHSARHAVGDSRLLRGRARMWCAQPFRGSVEWRTSSRATGLVASRRTRSAGAQPASASSGACDERPLSRERAAARASSLSLIATAAPRCLSGTRLRTCDCGRSKTGNSELGSGFSDCNASRNHAPGRGRAVFWSRTSQTLDGSPADALMLNAARPSRARHALLSCGVRAAADFTEEEPARTRSV